MSTLTAAIVGGIVGALAFSVIELVAYLILRKRGFFSRFSSVEDEEAFS